MNRAFLTKLHLILAAFMFPAVLMFLITGALYTWGEKGAWYEETATIALEQPLSEQSEGAITNLAVQELASRELPMPSGNLSVTEGEGASLTWNGARAEIELAATDNPLVAEATIREASFHRWLVQLHKAKGSDYFKVYATLLASVLFLLVASGVIMGLQVKALRRITIASSVVGLFAFVGAVLLG
ncbi:PepSY domain-containing protein [Altererythrobacter lutimaris]|uniref:PepSY domain-containing protein n=1 Tax=Altererythrobacter lutimaris TaxID=2743979 RepID=A0A850H8E3_9SPHN|nr:PepSY domain-containing protein [Altererythrobacter lutimaris]